VTAPSFPHLFSPVTIGSVTLPTGSCPPGTTPSWPAAGARPYRPPLEIMDEPWVADAWQVIRDPAAVPSGHIVVADWRGEKHGIPYAAAEDCLAPRTEK
jgi:hypothetical protein